jgi:hypothetical protein
MTEVETKGTAIPLRLIIIVAVVATLIVGGLFLFTGTNSASTCSGEGACMLYFYADG